MIEEIKPKLDKLRSDKTEFLSYQRACAELERLDKIVVAHEYATMSERADVSNREIADLAMSKDSLVGSLNTWQQEIEQAQTQRKEIETQRRKVRIYLLAMLLR